MKVHVLEREQRVARPLTEVFEFFARADNLERIAPPWLSFGLVSQEPSELRRGTLLQYRLRSVRWAAWRSSPLVFWFDPRCQGLRGSRSRSRCRCGRWTPRARASPCPGPRSATQLLGQRPDAAYQRVADRFGAVTVGERDELAVAGLALNQRRDPVGTAEQQIAFQ